MTTENTQDSKQPAIPPLPPAAGSAEMLELPNDTKIRFCNAFDAIKAHCILCKECDLYLRWGDGDLCSTGKAMIALEMCYTDTHLCLEAKQWREIAEDLIEYSNPRVTKGAEYTATVQRANELRPPNDKLTP